MMRGIIGFSLRFRLLVVVLAGVLMFFGVKRLREIPVNVLPEFSRPYVEIQTEALGLSAEEVEAMITTPLEADMLNGAAWVEEIRSESIPGLSSIRLYFEPGTDILNARQMTQERMTEVYSLPSVSKPPVMLQPLSSSSRCMKVGLSSDELSLIHMSILARWTIKPRLLGVPGVANVSIWGQRERQLQVLVHPQKLHDHGISLNQIVSTTGNALWVSPLTYLDAAVPGTGGFIDTPNQRLGIRHLFPISTAEQLAEVPVEGTDLRLGDVANVVEDHQPLIGDAVVDDAPALMLVVERFPWASTLDVTRGVEEALDALRPGLTGLEMDSSLFRPATFIETAMQNLTRSLLLGGMLLSSAALAAMLGSWRGGLIAVVAILLSTVTAGLVICVLGATVNMLVLAGLLIGLVVMIDDAVVSTQNILQRVRQNGPQSGSEESISWIIREATIEVQGTLLYATMIIFLALAPVIFMEGLSAAFLQPPTYTFVLAVICSLLVALVVTPVLSILLFRKAHLAADESPVVSAVRCVYDTTIGRLLPNPTLAVVVAGVFVVVAIAIFPAVRQESLFPSFKELDLIISLDGKPGTSHPAMRRVATKLSRELRSISGVKNVSAHIGRAITSDEVTDVDSSELWVNIDTSADYDTTVAEVKRIVAAYPGFDRDVETYLDERISEEIGGEGRGLIVRVYGDDLRVLRRKAEEVQRLLAKIDGLDNPEVEYPEEAPRVEIEPDLERCAMHGIKPGDVRRAAAVLLSGIEVGSLFEEQKVFQVVVWGDPKDRDSLTAVKELRVDTPTGDQVRLEDVAHVRVVSGPMVINREAVARYIDVAADVRGRDLAAIGGDVNRGLAEIDFPLEYRAEMLGETAERLATQQRVKAFAIAALIGIFLLYQAAYGNWKLALLLLAMLPLSMVGGLVAACAEGGLISFGSIMGFVALLAIAARHNVLLIRRYQALAIDPKAAEVDPEFAPYGAMYTKKGPFDDGRPYGEICAELVRQGTQDRLAPVVMTFVATALAFAPIRYFGDIPGHEIVFPMAGVVLGGLVTSTLATLYLLPALYLWFKPGPELESTTESIALGQAERAV